MNIHQYRKKIERIVNDCLDEGEVSPADMVGALEWIKLSLQYSTLRQITQEVKK